MELSRLCVEISTVFGTYASVGIAVSVFSEKLPPGISAKLSFQNFSKFTAYINGEIVIFF
jgi:hypothetical protein